jgi:hypothetical protein
VINPKPSQVDTTKVRQHPNEQDAHYHHVAASSHHPVNEFLDVIVLVAHGLALEQEDVLVINGSFKPIHLRLRAACGIDSSLQFSDPCRFIVPDNLVSSELTLSRSQLLLQHRDTLLHCSESAVVVARVGESFGSEKRFFERIDGHA